MSRFQTWRFFTLLFGAAGILSLSAQEEKKWPRQYNGAVPRWEIDKAGAGDLKIYRTALYKFASPVELSRKQIEGMARTAEAVPHVLEAFPLRLLPKSAPEKRPIRIYADHDTYLAKGGLAGSVGFFSSRTGEVAVSLDFLIERDDPRWRLPARQRYRLLVHELVHQAMGQRINELPAWLTEGIAEYFAATQLTPGRYQFTESGRLVKEHLRAVWAPSHRGVVVVPKLSEVALLSYSQWNADNDTNQEDPFGKYAASLFLVHYFMEQASRERGSLTAYLEERPTAKIIERGGRRYRMFEPPSQDMLWKDASPADLEKILAKYWKTQGLNLDFSGKLGR